MTETENKTQFPYGLLASAPFLLVVIYLAAIGPLNWLLSHGYLGDDVAESLIVIYYPVRYLVQVSETFAWCIEYYDRLFRT